MTYPTAEWIEYGPQEAANLLEANTANRKLRRTAVEKYRRDMLAGDWKANGDTIKVATDGTLIDGQHRLEAILQAGSALPRKVPILTVKGLDHDEVMAITDTGLRRTPQDALYLNGYKNTALLSAMVRGVIRIETGRIFKWHGDGQNVSNSELLHWLEKNPEAPHFVDSWGWRIRKTNVPPGAGATAFWILHTTDTWRAAAMIDSLVSLENLPKGSALATLASTITRLRIAKTSVTALQWVRMILQTWNAWQADQPAPVLQPTAPVTRQNFPQPLTRDEALAGAEASALIMEQRDQDELPVN